MKRKSVVMLVATTMLVASAATVAWAAGKDPDPPAGSHDRRVGAAAAPVYQPASTDTQFVPLAACVVADTSRAGGRLKNKATRTLVVRGTTGFSAQGGAATGCGVPADALSVQVNVMVTKPKKTNTLTIGAAGATPSLVVAAFSKGKVATGSATVMLTGSPAGSIAVRASTGTPYVKVWVTGYTHVVEPLAGFISPSGQPYSGSPRILGSARVSTGVFEVQFDREIRYCAATTTAYSSAYYTSASTWFDSSRPDTVRVYVWNATGSPADQYFYIAVSC